jgi:hypothetical protein
MIRTLLVLAFCLVSASAFVAPVNNAVGEFGGYVSIDAVMIFAGVILIDKLKS